LKTNETLPNKPNPVSEGLAMKPRIITTVNPETHAFTIPFCDAAKYALIDHWHMDNVFQFRGKNVRIVYGASLDNEQRASLIDKILACADDVIVVAGDDSLVRCDGNWYTCDYSRYDSTQKEGVLIIAADIWMAAMGFNEETKNIFQSVYSTEFSTKFGPTFDFKVTGTMPFQFSTGLGLTTVGNSVTNALALLDVGSRPVGERATSFARLGLVAKENQFQTPAGMDFLKGWYVPADTGGYTYQPLPSRVLKLGKISKDPCALTRRPQSEWRQAAKEVAHALHQGHPGVTRNMPFFGDLLELYRRVGMEGRMRIERNQVIENAEYSVTDGTHREVCMETWHTLMAARYDITPDECADFASMMKDPALARAFPVMINHPALDKLRAVDY
jgi:hypothetical protein